MKIVHLMAGDLSGGAARGAYWLHQALVRLGVDSRVLINAPHSSSDDRLISINTTKSQRVWQGVTNRLSEFPKQLYRVDTQHQQFDIGLGGSHFQRHDAFIQADIIHLHHINGAVSLRSLSRIRRPMIWTLRSMWPLTGGCHYRFRCNKYKSGCSRCPQLGHHFPLDLARYNTRKKRASYPRQLQFVGVSKWISDCARESALLNEFPISTIHNGIDTEVFRPAGRAAAKKSLGLEAETRYLLVVAQNFRNRYKGFDALKRTLGHLDPKGLHLLVVGRMTPAQLNELAFPHTSLGMVSDPAALRQIYSAASVFLASNLMETFGKTIVEAMACGTPAVCFNTTGPRDIIEHQTSGYCADSFKPQALADGVRWILGLPENAYAELSINARNRAVTRFDTMISGQKYLDLYNATLRRNSQSAAE